MPMGDKEIKKLKTLMSAAKSQPINIAVCLGLKFDGLMICIDKVKSPENLAREAKSQGQTTKVSCGTVTVEGTTAFYKCADKPPSNTKSQLKAYLKSIKLSYGFKLTDASGNDFAEEGQEGESAEDADDGAPGDIVEEVDVAEEEEEEAANPQRDQWHAAWALAEPRIARALQTNGPDSGKFRAVRDFALGKAEAGQFEAALKSLATLMGLLETTAKTGPKDGGQKPPQTADRAELLDRLGKLKPRVAGVKGPLEQKLAEMFQKIVEQVKGGSLDQAADNLTKLEAAVSKIEASKPEPVTSNEPAPDPKLVRIIAAESQLRRQVTDQSSGDAEAAMLAVLDRVTEALKKGEAETALSGLKRVQDGLKLQAEVSRLSPIVAKAASSGQVADVNALTLLFNTIAGQIPAADHAKAMAALVRVEEMIAAGKTQDKTAFEQDQPLEIRPYAEARINWNLTRGKLRTEIGRLQESISKALAAEGLDGELVMDDTLFSYIEKLDARLEAKLAEIVNSDPGQARDTLKSEARGLIAEYNDELNSDFFRDIDDNNGFVQLAVASTARDVLNDLSKVLAA